MTTDNPIPDNLRTVASNLRTEGHTSRAILLENAADEFDRLLLIEAAAKDVPDLLRRAYRNEAGITELRETALALSEALKVSK